MKITIITVCLNPGEGLKKTIESIEKQTFKDIEVLIKDGGSTDGSLAAVPGDMKYRILFGDDTGIYDAMNMAIKESSGDFIIFMNAGDRFYDDEVLARVAERVGKREKKENLILYGDTCSDVSGTVVKASSVINSRVCYRNIPCHQAIFYSGDLFGSRLYDTDYIIRADYEHFLWCYFENGTEFEYLDFPVCFYEGRGVSDSRKNVRILNKEHNVICRKYIPFGTRFLMRARMIITLRYLRTALARSKTFGESYENLRRKFIK